MVGNVERRRRALAGQKQCPTEAHCEIFQSAGPPQEMVCGGCEHLPTKPSPLAGETAHILRRIEQLAAERDSGYVPPLAVLWPYEFELLKVRDQAEQQITCAEQGATRRLMEAVFRALVEGA